MLDQNVAKAKKVVEGYKEHNLNTKERFVQIAPKTWVAVREHTDENAAKFAEKLLKDSKEEKKDKRLNKVQKSGPKSKIAPKPRGPRPPRVVKPTYTQTLGEPILALIQKGLTKQEIMENLGCAECTVRYHYKLLLTEYPDLKLTKAKSKREGKKGLSKENLIMKELLEQGYSSNEIQEITGKAQNTVSHHLKILGAKIGAKWLNQVKKAKKQRIEQNFKNNYKS